MSYKVFISHSDLDKSHVRNLNSILSLYGIETYLAENDLRPFEFLSEKIKRNIENSDCVIVLLTKNGIKSNYVQNEIGISVGFNKLVIPIVEIGTPLKDLAILQGREYIPFNPLRPQEVLFKTANYLRSLKLQKEEQEKALWIIGSFVSFLLLLSNANE